ncbi:MAG: hypothetical protein MUF87_15495 [Anaerolineae bacterium]|jgi:hypothetical protein|nr:hypothetical protein [Anaerolineae bacterium]
MMLKFILTLLIASCGLALNPTPPIAPSACLLLSGDLQLALDHDSSERFLQPALSMVRGQDSEESINQTFGINLRVPVERDGDVFPLAIAIFPVNITAPYEGTLPLSDDPEQIGEGAIGVFAAIRSLKLDNGVPSTDQRFPITSGQVQFVVSAIDQTERYHLTYTLITETFTITGQLTVDLDQGDSASETVIIGPCEPTQNRWKRLKEILSQS